MKPVTAVILIAIEVEYLGLDESVNRIRAKFKYAFEEMKRPGD
jgi:hypothetical protein